MEEIRKNLGDYVTGRSEPYSDYEPKRGMNQELCSNKH